MSAGFTSSASGRRHGTVVDVSDDAGDRLVVDFLRHVEFHHDVAHFVEEQAAFAVVDPGHVRRVPDEVLAVVCRLRETWAGTLDGLLESARLLS